MKPSAIFEAMPNDLMTSISYFNIPVDDAQGGRITLGDTAGIWFGLKILLSSKWKSTPRRLKVS